MATTKQKYYVVWHGLEPGIYTTWPECQRQVKGFEGAVYKSFATRQEAEEAYRSPASDYVSTSTSESKSEPFSFVPSPLMLIE